MGTNAPPRVYSPEELEALIKEARERQSRRRVAVAAAVAILAGSSVIAYSLAVGRNLVPAPGRGSGRPAVSSRSASCGVRVRGPRVYRGDRVVYRERIPTPMHSEVRCSGTSVWVVFDNGVGMSHEGYVAVHSADGGDSWRLVFSQDYGTNTARGPDAYLGPWTLNGSAAYFTGSCAPCEPFDTVSLTVLEDGGRAVQHYRVAALTGYTPIAIRIARHQVVISGRRMLPGRPPRKTVRLRVA